MIALQTRKQQQIQHTFVVHLSISVDIGLTNHLVDFLVGQLLSQIRHHVAKFSGRDETVAVLVEHLQVDSCYVLLLLMLLVCSSFTAILQVICRNFLYLIKVLAQFFKNTKMDSLIILETSSFFTLELERMKYNSKKGHSAGSLI